MPSRPAAVVEAPFFIVGAGRSGTTLLRLMMAGHSRIHIPPETWWIAPLVRQLPLAAVLTPAQLVQALAIITEHERWADMQLEAPQLHALADALDHPRLGDIINLVYAHQLRLSGKPRLGDKTPHYCMIVSELMALYPDAKFIHMIRDGRDVAISWAELGWDRFYERGFAWPHAVARMQAYRGTPIGSRILDVRYEALVHAPEIALARICRFLGEQFEPEMLQPHRRTDLIPVRERGIHGMLHQPITDTGTQVWRQKLGAVECFAMEACLATELRRLGYPLRFAAPAWRPALAAFVAVLRSSAPLLRRFAAFIRQRHLFPISPYL